MANDTKGPRMNHLRMLSALTAAAASVLVIGCATPVLDAGFVVRSDMNTTDCAGHTQGDINAVASGAFDFLKVKEPGDVVEVDDCAHPGGKTTRAAGLALQPGDVLFLSTGVVGPAYQSGGNPFKVTTPANVASPAGLALRRVDADRGRLYLQEDQFLAAAFSMAGRYPHQALPPGNQLAVALDRRQAILWNRLIDNLKLWRLPNLAGAPVSERPALVLLVNHGSWCDDVRSDLKSLSEATNDVEALTTFFSGTANACPGDQTSDRKKLTTEFSRITDQARSALQAVASMPAAAGAYPATPSQLALHTNVTLQVKGARIAAGETYHGNAHWTLSDWEAAGICKSETGAPLFIKAFQLRDRKWVYLVSEGDREPTLEVELVFSQSRQARRFVERGRWFEQWRRVMAHADLDKLYPSDLRAVTWNSPPAEPAMCLF